MKVKQDNILTWFQWLRQWIRQTFRKRSTKKKPLVVFERIYSKDEITILLSVERDSPGAIATWYLLNKNNPSHNLLITLDNIAAIRLFLRKHRPVGRELSFLELSTLEEDTLIRTHRFSVQWIIKLQSSRTIFSTIGTWDADLQGNSFDTNAKAMTILGLVVREALNLPPIPGVEWRSRMTKFPWTESVESYSYAVLGEKHKCYTKKLTTPVSR